MRQQQQQQQPQYEFSTDEENDFEEYGIQDAAEEEVDLEVQDDDEEEDLVYEDDSDDLDDGNPSQAQMPQGYQQHLPPHYPAGQAARPQMQTTLTLNINGQPIQINQQNQQIQQQSMGMNNITQLTNILESINPYLGAGGGQPQQMGDPS